MRIAIDAWAAAEVRGGRGRYVRELLRALKEPAAGHDVTLLTRVPWDGLGALPERWSWEPVRGPGPAWVFAAARAARAHADVLLATQSYALGPLARRPFAAVVYDLFGLERAHGVPRGAWLERLTLPLAARRARALVCISEATRDALLEHYPDAAGRAVAIPLAAPPQFAAARPDAAVAARHGLPERYVLTTATLEPRKNLPRLVRAWAAVRSEHPEAVLALVGAQGWGNEELDAELARAGEGVRTLGAVGDEELAALYAGATAVAFPSLAEGFGLPVLEGMAAGAPVLTSDRSSLAEVAGDAAVLVDPESDEAVADGLRRLLGDGDLRDDLRRRGRERAATYSWERTARETLAVLEGIAR